MPQKWIKRFFATSILFLTVSCVIGADAGVNAGNATPAVGISTTDTSPLVAEQDSSNVSSNENEKQFNSVGVIGYSFLKSDNLASLNLISNKTVQPDYILKSGDEVVIDVWGELDLHYTLTINNDGYIIVPNVGRIDLNGLSFIEGKKRILNQLASKYSFYIDASNPGAGRAHVDITLGKVAGVAIYMTGEVAHPGMIYLNGSNCSIVSALKTGGGISPSGSLRNIEVTSASGEKFIFDLYTFLFNGKMTTAEKYLKDGDTINVPFRESTVVVNGAVLRPGVYEIVKNEKLRNLIGLAGGVASNATGEVDVFRIQKETEGDQAGVKNKEILKINTKNSNEDLALFDGDEIVALRNSAAKFFNTIIIAGNGIKMPSEQKYVSGLKITDYIEKTGGIYPDAADTVELIRTNKDLAKDIINLSLKEILENKPNQNLVLKPGDRITFFTNEDMYGKRYIYLEGHVKEPGKYDYYDGLTVYDMLVKQGGLKDPDFQKETYLKQANIIRMNPTQTLEFLPFEIGLLLSGEMDKNIKLFPGDVVRVYARKTMVMDKFVTIQGKVKKPGTYKVDDNANLNSLIIDAGGFEPDALINKIEITSKSNDGSMQKVVTILDYSTLEAKNYGLKNNQLIIVPEDPYYTLRNATVTVEGQVKVPGAYGFVQGEKLLDIIKRSGGTTDDAFIEGASFYRDGKRTELDIDESVKDPNGVHNIILCAGDRLVIPKISYFIPVSGAVKNPRLITFKEGQAADYYIDKCYGFSKDADSRNTELKYPNGDTKDAFRWYWFDREVPIGSSIVVPAKQ